MPISSLAVPGRRKGDLDWEVLRDFQNRSIFVGRREEYDAFQKEFGLSVTFAHAADFLELSRIVAGAKLVVSDENFVFSLAEAIKVPRVLDAFDATNCLPQSKNGHTCLTKSLIEFYLSVRDDGGETKHASFQSVSQVMASLGRNNGDATRHNQVLTDAHRIDYLNGSLRTVTAKRLGQVDSTIPKLTLITALIRPQNLSQLERTAAEVLSVGIPWSWIVVVDEKFVTERMKNPSVSAHVIYRRIPERSYGFFEKNEAIDVLEEDSWVYFMDDDTELHPSFGKLFIETVADHPDAALMVFGVTVHALWISEGDGCWWKWA